MSSSTATTTIALQLNGKKNITKVTCKRCGYVATKHRKMKLPQAGTAVSFWCPGCTSNRGVCLDCSYQMILRGPLNQPPRAMRCHFDSKAHQHQVQRCCAPKSTANKKVPVCTPSPALDTTTTTINKDPDPNKQKKLSTKSHKDEEDSEDDEEDVMLLSLKKKPSKKCKKRKAQEDVTSESDSDDEEDVMLISLKKKKTSKSKKKTSKKTSNKKAKISKSSSSDEEMEDNHQQPVVEERDPLDMDEEPETEVIDNSFRLRCKICRDCAWITQKYESVRMWGTALAGDVVRFKCSDVGCYHQWAVCRTCDDFKIEGGNFMAIHKHFKSSRHQRRVRECYPTESDDDSVDSEDESRSQASDRSNLFCAKLEDERRRLEFEEEDADSSEEEEEEDSQSEQLESDYSSPGCGGYNSSDESDSSNEWEEQSSVALSELTADEEEEQQSETDDSDSD